jgi:hypothetical protein
MTDRNDMYAADADAAGKQDEMDRDPDILPDQDLDQAAGGVNVNRKTGGDAEADMSVRKNDKPESDHIF